MLPKPSKARLHILCRMQGSCGSFLRRRVLLSAGHTTAQLRQLGRMPGSAVRCGCSILYLSEHHMPEAYMLKTAMHWFNRRGREWVCPSHCSLTSRFFQSLHTVLVSYIDRDLHKVSPLL